ncbi:MAG TPA: hypothetical protein VFG69_07800 [Nannocystaceae bacterium]|nr:hypothetical protein [Nannocystaceae bacterium]
MSERLPAVVPWIVAEQIALELATRRPTTVHVTRDPGGRIHRQLEPDDGEPALPWTWVAERGAAIDCLLWVGDGCTASADARADVLALAPSCTDVVLLVEPLVPGNGLGLHLLRAIDPGLRLLVSDEVTDGADRTRERKPWEPAPRWAVAVVRAWRFDPDAEIARDGFRARLPRMGAAEIVVAARRVLARFPRAHELLALGAAALVQRGDLDGARIVAAELECLADAPPSLVAEVRRSVLGVRPPVPVRPTG